MKAIIVAAGPGKRLLPFTEGKPKCMLEVGGKTILQTMLTALKESGITDTVMVKGYKKDVINYPDIKYYFNPNYLENNILTSLFYAEKEMKDGFIFSYSDILYHKDVVQKLLESQRDISLVVDTDWAPRYKGRTLHPTDEAEFVVVKNGRIVKISKFMNPDIAYGEFIGLAKFTRKGAEILIRNYNRIRTSQWCGFKEFHRFQDAVSIDKAYLTDMLQELIDRGYPIYNVDIDGGWLEI
ncbi:MAG: NTP transferase domain-containing protein, partial [Candidatus Hermodarchaeota archaeon]